jgi:small subunit ribosomal protein S15
MALDKVAKETVIKKHQRSELDTGSCEVQVALLTTRILDLTGHFKTNKNDVHSQRGLIKMVNRRRKLLSYLKRTESDRYLALINTLGLRK